MKTLTDNPFNYDRSLQVQEVTRVVSGDVTETWADLELDVRAELIYAGAKDDEEAGQPLNIERRRYKIMESGRAFNPDTMRFRETDESADNWFYLTRVTPWMGSKWVSVIEGVNRSDD
jgi:hypothetical protein